MIYMLTTYQLNLSRIQVHTLTTLMILCPVCNQMCLSNACYNCVLLP